MQYDFDQRIDRRDTGSIKWETYGGDVLPMWVADMDFRSPEPVIQALCERVEHGVFGYAMAAPRLLEVLCERLLRLYDWRVAPEQIILLPGLVTGLNMACRAAGAPGDGVLVQTPVYSPFLSAPPSHGLHTDVAGLSCVTEGQTLRYEVDFDAFEAAITPRTRLFLACHPHNPVGRDFNRDELARMADICLRHNLVICSDEIHCDLLLDGRRHTPIAALAPEIADRCITLMAPSKTFNLAGLGCSFAVVPNAKLRKGLMRAGRGIVPGVNALGLVAAQAAYEHGCEWLTALQHYLTGNRDALTAYAAEHLPRIRMTVPEATYLGWLDCRDAGIDGNPRDFFLQHARVALGDGKGFGPGGEGFVRLNFGCPRSLLMQALEQMRAALQQQGGGA